MNPISSLLIEERASSLRFATSRALRTYLPQSGRSRRPKRCIRVDLPEPERPRTATNSPGSIERDTSETARTTPAPQAYCLEICVMWTSDISEPQPEPEITTLAL